MPTTKKTVRTEEEVVDKEKEFVTTDNDGNTVTNKTQDTRKKVVELTLNNSHSINGVSYPAGTHEVPAEVAEDLARNDKAHDKYLSDLNKNNSVNSNQGTINAS